MSFYDDDERNDDDDDGQNQQDQYAQLPVKDLRALRKAAKERDQQAAQMQTMQRELAFARAGLDLDSPQLKYFVKAYDGELSAEAIRTAAEEAGFIQPKQSGVTDDERQAHQRMDGAGAGATGTGAENAEDGLMALRGKSRDEIMGYLAKQGVPTSWNRPEDF